MEIADRKPRGQERVQNARGQTQINGGDDRLAESQPRPWQGKFPALELERLPPAEIQREIDRRQAQQQHSHRTERNKLVPVYHHRPRRPGQEGEAAGGQQAQPETDRTERDYPGHVPCRNSPGRIEPIADRAPAEQGKAQVVAERIGHEGCRPDQPVRDALAHIAESQGVVTGEQEVVERGQGAGQENPGGGDSLHRLDYVMVMVVPKLVEQDPQRPGQQRQPKQRAGYSEGYFFHRFILSAFLCGG